MLFRGAEIELRTHVFGMHTDGGRVRMRRLKQWGWAAAPCESGRGEGSTRWISLGRSPAHRGGTQIARGEAPRDMKTSRGESEQEAGPARCQGAVAPPRQSAATRVGEGSTGGARLGMEGRRVDRAGGQVTLEVGLLARATPLLGARGWHSRTTA